MLLVLPDWCAMAVHYRVAARRLNDHPFARKPAEMHWAHAVAKALSPARVRPVASASGSEHAPAWPSPMVCAACGTGVTLDLRTMVVASDPANTQQQGRRPTSNNGFFRLFKGGGRRPSDAPRRASEGTSFFGFHTGPFRVRPVSRCRAFGETGCGPRPPNGVAAL